MLRLRFLSMAAGAVLAVSGMSGAARAGDIHDEPWRDTTRALVLDAYEYNEIDWQQVVTDRRITGFIGKATDGLPPDYRCKDRADKTEFLYCRLAWRRYSLSKELYQTRRAVARALGLKWGAYHLARPGNPIEQADHFLEFTNPAPDDLIALDIEDNNPREFLSLEDAEIFVRRIHQRTGRYPLLYTNGQTSKHIADHRERYPLLSRLKLWYARYKPDIGEHFPKGNWESYTLWQFVSHINCNKRACPYRVPGTNRDIDVNVAPYSVAQLRHHWPFNGLVPPLSAPLMAMAEVPVPVTRAMASATPATMVPVTEAPQAARAVDMTGTAELFARLTDFTLGYHQRLSGLAPALLQPDKSLETASIAPATAIPVARQCASEDIVQAVERTGDDGALGRDHDGPLDQNRIGSHRLDQLLVGEGRIVKAQFAVEGALLADQVARRDADRCDEFTQLGGIGRGLQVFDDLRLVPGLAYRGERLARGGACRVVVDGDAHASRPSSRAMARQPMSVR